MDIKIIKRPNGEPMNIITTELIGTQEQSDQFAKEMGYEANAKPKSSLEDYEEKKRRVRIALILIATFLFMALAIFLFGLITEWHWCIPGRVETGKC